MHRRVVLAALALLIPRPAAAVDAWTRVGPEAGAVRTLAAAPSRPATVYAGLDLGGVFRSPDGGATWSFAGAGIDLHAAIAALAVDARRPDTLWAGTSQGIYRSVDGGAAWRLVNGSDVISLAADPAVSGTLYAGTWNGPVLRSRDGGASWQTLAGSPRGASVLAVDPARPQNLYAGTGRGLFKSVNGGASWTPINRGLPYYPRIDDIAIDPRSPSTLYITTSSAQGEIVFRSDDRGQTWTALDLGSLGYVAALEVEPGKKGAVWVAVMGRPYRSLDQGRTWIPAGTGLPAASVTALLPGASTLLAGTSFGVFRSADQGASWSFSSRGITAASISGLALDRLRPMRLWTAAGPAVYRTTNGGVSWAALAVGPPPDLFAISGPLASDPNRPGVAYLGYRGGIARTVDTGAHWSTAQLQCVRPLTITVDPRSSSTVYAAGFFYQSFCLRDPNVCGIFRSDDSGQTWTCIRNGLVWNATDLLVPDPLQPSTVYVLSAGGLYRSTDRGDSWTLLSPDFNASILVPDPLRPGRLWAGGQGEVLRSDDGGQTWTQAGTGIPEAALVTALVLDPVDPEILYAATLQQGVFKTADGGATWTPLGKGLERLTTRFLVIDPRSRDTLYAGTDEAGVLKIRQSGG
jgi:photosystem II stability/assembly factor-like uncharacterized protein